MRGHRRVWQPDSRYRPSHHRRDLSHLRHQFVELVREQRLHAIGESHIRLVMHFDDQPIGAHRNRRPRKGSNFVAFTGAVAGVHHNRQMVGSISALRERC